MKTAIKKLILLSLALYVTTATARSNDFNSLIQESWEAKRQLQHELKMNVNSLDTEQSKLDQDATVVQEKLSEENVAAVSTEADKIEVSKTNKSAKKLDKKQLKRVSEEIEAAKDF